MALKLISSLNTVVLLVSYSTLQDTRNNKNIQRQQKINWCVIYIFAY